jgi:predicted lipoprotein with Yx(FWY)xxD motif
MLSTINPSRTRLAAMVGSLVLIVAACSSAGGASSAPSAAPSTAASAAAGGGAITVVVANGTVGAYLTGKDGNTLYTFKADSMNTSACLDACAAKWPPFTIGGSDTLKPGDGVMGSLTTFARPDGSMQVAYNGAPLYYYAADSKAGDTTGQGFGGKWFVASPTGTAPASGGSAAPSAAPSSSGGSHSY